MSDALSFAEIDVQHLELLPARTVMSMFALIGQPGDGGTGGNGGNARGGVGLQALLINPNSDEAYNTANGTGGNGGDANPGNYAPLG